MTSRLEPAGVVLAGFQGTRIPRDLEELIKSGLAGVILFSRNIESPEQVAELSYRTVSISPGGRPLIAVDQEGGRVARLGRPATDWPAARQVGCAGGPGLARRVGKAMARELAVVGFNWDLAPVLDVDSNPNNPIIGDRSFSSSPGEVASLAVAFAAGLVDGGIAPCGKHFPGHGDTDLDSHRALPVVDAPANVLRSREIVPFKAAIDWGIPAIMTAHVVYRALDPDRCATLSPDVIGGLLRKDLGFKGVVVSDALNMAAIAEERSIEEAVVEGMVAGIDLFIACEDPGEPFAAIQALKQEAEKSPAFRDLLRASVERVRRFQNSIRPRGFKPDREGIRRVLGCKEHLELVRYIENKAPDSPSRKQ